MEALRAVMFHLSTITLLRLMFIGFEINLRCITRNFHQFVNWRSYLRPLFLRNVHSFFQGVKISCILILKCSMGLLCPYSSNKGFFS